MPLDITTVGNTGKFPGTIWVGDVANGSLTAFEPNDFGGSGGGTCTGANDASLDEDGDGYTNADETANGTNPCSAADFPPDWDNDKVSNLSDPDDDNDTQPDKSDKFAIDANNGTTTTVPAKRTFDNNGSNPGGLLGLGFTGLMTNGAANYESLYNAGNMTAGGAAGVMTIDRVSEGTSLGTANTQQYAFQYGVKVPASGVYTAHTRINGPFSGITPQNDQSMGLFIGTGGQDDYVKIVTSANGGAGGIQFVKEVGGVVTNRPQAAVTMPGPSAVDLYLNVNVGAGTVQPSYSVTSGGVTGARTNLGGTEPIPTGWLMNAASGLAVGVISTSAGPGPEYAATWDFVEFVAADTTAPTVASTVPASGATGVSASANISATFTESMEPATISSTNFSLVKQGGATTPIAASVGYNDASKTATLDPSASLEAGATYTATVKGGTGGAADLSGNPLAVDKVWNFTTAAAADTTSPTVTARAPAPAATAVPTGTTVTASFSEAMTAATITSTNVYLAPTSTPATAVSAALAYDPASKTVTLTPAAPLASSTSYTATVKGGTGGVADSAGNTLAATDTWSFTTAAAADTTFQEKSGQVVIEAESFSANIPRGGGSWVSRTTPTGYGGTSAMVSEPNTGAVFQNKYATRAPELKYEVNFATTGTYQVWLRGHVDGTADNSVHVGLDGAETASSDKLVVSAYGVWTWHKSTMDGPVATVNVTTVGVHTIHVWVREDGYRLDRLLLTTDAAFTPTGIGPAESPRAP